MPVSLLGSASGWLLSRCGGVGAVPTGGWSPSVPTSPLPSPRLLLVGWSSCGWGGDAATSCPTSALPLPLLFLGFNPRSWKQQRVGRAGQDTPTPQHRCRGRGGETRTPPAQRWHNAEPPLPPCPSVSARKAVTQAAKTAQGEKKRVLSGGAAAVAGQHRLLVVKRVPRLQRLP